MKHAYYDSPIGMLHIVANDNAISRIERVLEQGASSDSDPLLADCRKQLAEYFAGSRRAFDLPLSLEATEFQTNVWNHTAQIGYGSVVSYKEVATKTGNGNASRAVGGALNKNPVLIAIPCHRVVGAGGSLTGFAAGLEAKDWLIRHEREICK